MGRNITKAVCNSSRLRGKIVAEHSIYLRMNKIKNAAAVAGADHARALPGQAALLFWAGFLENGPKTKPPPLPDSRGFG